MSFLEPSSAQTDSAPPVSPYQPMRRDRASQWTFWSGGGGPDPPETDAGLESNLARYHVADSFRVLEKLGESSHGWHYRAEMLGSGVEVELLTLRPHGLGAQPNDTTVRNGWLWDQLYRARGISHPNVAGVKAMGESPEGLRYVALEVLQGELLSEILIARGILPLEDALDLILQAASGLQAAHKTGLHHGDLSPGSILVTRTAGHRPLVKLIRFGLTHPGTVGGAEGTSYAAPERLDGKSGDERSDIFSLGAVLHHLLTGEAPTDAPSKAGSIPKPLRSIVSRALEPVPGRRFGSVAAFVRALEEARGKFAGQGEGETGRKIGAVAIGAGFGAGFAIVAAAGLWLLPSMQPPRTEPLSGRGVLANGPVAAAPPADVARRESASSDARPSAKKGPSVRKGPPAKSESATPRVRKSRKAEAGRSEARDPNPVPQPDSVLGYAPGVTAEPPAGAAPPLERTDAMRLALDEVTRLRIVSYYEEVEPGVLILVLGSVNRTSPAVEESLTRLYAAYAELLDYPDTGPVMELWQNGRKVGEYP